MTDQNVETTPASARRRVDRLKLSSYLLAVALTAVATVFFGRYGFFLGLVVLVLVKVAFWAVPLVKLSYASDTHEPQPRQ